MKRACMAIFASTFLTLAIGTPPTALAEPGNVALELEKAFTDVAEMAFPAVVVITNKRVDRRPLYPEMDIPPELRYFFGLPPPQRPRSRREAERPKVPQPAGKGSGIIIRADGFVLTNYHVIEGSDALEVKLADGRVFDNARDEDEVRIVGKDEETDLALLKIGGGKLQDLPVLAFADSDSIKPGQWAIAVGAPFNLDYSVTIGHVSQKGRHDVGMTNYRDYIQTDASINPGNSGGPLLDIRGRLIGINNFIMTGGSRGSVGVGFAIASNLAKQVADDLIEHGEVVRPFLGISMQPLTEELKEQFGVESGVLVSQVLQGDPADKAGVEPGDVILKVGDREVRSPSEVQFAVLKYDPGEAVVLLVDRGGKRKTFTVVARRRNGTDSSSGPVPGSDDLLDEIGLVLEAQEDAVVVAQVADGSPAAAANLRRGDRILEVNREEVRTIAQVLSALRRNRRNVAVLYIERGNSKFFVPLQFQHRE